MKVCAVIGYGPGIGDAVARRWSSAGFKVVILSRTLSKLEAACKKLENAVPYAADVTDEKSLQSALEKVEAEVGPIETLMYNAGSGTWKTYDQLSYEDMDRSLKTNVHGLLVAAKTVCPKMEQRGGGRLIVTGATASLRGVPFTAGFAPAKGGQRLLAQSLARTLWKKNIHVSLAVIDGMVGVGDNMIHPDSIAEAYWHLATQPADCQVFEINLKPKTSDMSVL